MHYEICVQYVNNNEKLKGCRVQPSGITARNEGRRKPEFPVSGFCLIQFLTGFKNCVGFPVTSDCKLISVSCTFPPKFKCVNNNGMEL